MQFTRTLTETPGAAGTAFYFTEEADGGMTRQQQMFAADLVMEYRTRFRTLEINAVWDFGKEEGDPREGEKYGLFADSKINAVYNAQMLTISLNHARLRLLPSEADDAQTKRILAEYERQRNCKKRAAHLEGELLLRGVPWPQTGMQIMKMLEIEPQRGNELDIRDPYFADVQAIRMLEDTQSIERVLIHEIGHMLFEESGAVGDKKLKKLFSKCRDGFEDQYEFCAECFMAWEMTRSADSGAELSEAARIPLAEEAGAILCRYLPPLRSQK